jgi:hypothetical protein
MSRFGAAFLIAATLAATPAAAAEQVPHKITGSGAWGCRDKGDLVDLLFLGISVTFQAKLEAAIAEGRCVTFALGESVIIVEQGDHGIVKVQRGGATPAVYWTTTRYLN